MEIGLRGDIQKGELVSFVLFKGRKCNEINVLIGVSLRKFQSKRES